MKHLKIASRFCTAAFTGLFLAAAAPIVSSQPATGPAASGYPQKPIRLIVPYPPGGGADNVARLIASKLSARLSQSIIVDNRAGASGVIGTAAAVNAPPDGYTLLLTVSSLIQSAALETKPSYDALTDLVPISEIAQTNFVLLANKSVPADSLAQFIALAKANPGKFNYGSFGNGTSAHLFGEALNAATGLDMVHVPYKGTAPMLLGLLGGEVPVAFSDIGAAYPHLSANKLKAFASTGAGRFPILPDTPTFEELGISGLSLNGWYGLFAPANTDPAIVQKLSEELAEIVRTPEVVDSFRRVGLNAVGGTQEEFASALRRDEPRWTKLILETKAITAR